MYHALMAVQYIGIIILGLEIVFILFQNASRLQRDMIFLLVSLLVVFISYTTEMQSQSLREALLATKIGYVGKPFIVLTMLYLIMDYCRVRVYRWATVLMLGIQTFFTVIAFTSGRHTLFYKSIAFATDGIFPHLDLEHGPFYYLFMADTLFFCIAIYTICIFQLKKLDSGRERRQIILFMAMVAAPLVLLGIYMTDIFQGYDCTLIGYLFSTIGFSISFWRLNMFDTITLAREQVVDYIHGGLLVYDTRNRLIYHNELADQLDIMDKIEALAEGDELYPYEDKMYSVENREIIMDNVVYGRMCFIQDVTERYNYEQRLEVEKNRADEASEAKSEFLFSMSHDIRTPMNAILGMTKLASVHIDERERVEDCLKKIDISGQHLLELINAILDMNKIESGKLELYEEAFDLKELLEEVVTITTPLAQSAEHEFVTSFGEIENKAVFGDRSRISQVFTNIIGNAVKYTDKGGKIEFRALEKQGSLRTEEDGTSYASYIFEVQDNGIGMSEEYLSQVFDPFTRAKDKRVERVQGSGLGMAISKQFVELMGGSIRVTSKEGEGSCFTVELTLRLQTEEEARELSHKITIEDFAKLDISSKRVLLVEDYEINAEIAGEVLGMVGLTVEFAVNGKQAVEMIENCEDGYYDLVFMDVMMPVMNGYEATRVIRAMDREYAKNVPIVAMTANAFQEDVRNAINAGMNGHIAKPIAMDQLMHVLEQWLCGDA